MAEQARSINAARALSSRGRWTELKLKEDH